MKIIIQKIWNLSIYLLFRIMDLICLFKNPEFPSVFRMKLRIFLLLFLTTYNQMPG